MNEHIVQEWNKIVKPGDVAWILGDLCFKASVWEKYASRFNGQINVIYGNHDPKEFRQRAKWTDYKFASAHDVKMIEVNGQRIFMSHFAHRVWPNGHHGAWHLYGHDHGSLPDYGMSTDVGVDAWNFKPVSFEELKNRFKDREPIKHH
jgi:calcineurin-like phosphoesterase family protein